jgi:hypothetical protein
VAGHSGRGSDHHHVGWVGAQATGTVPRVRVSGSEWFNRFWLLPIGLVLLLVAVAQGLGGDPGTLYSAQAEAATGCPACPR